MSDTVSDLPAAVPPGSHATRRTVGALVATIGLLVVLAACLFLAYLRADTIHGAEERATAVARMLDEHVSRTLRTADFIAGQMVELARSAPMDQLAHDEKAWYRLTALKQGLPEQGSLWLVDAAGQVRLGTLAFPAPKVNVADRGYFRAHLEERRDLVIGSLVQTRIRDAQSFHVARRINGPDGQFAGVAVVAYDAGAFTDFFRNLGLGPSAALMVAGLDDGRIVLRQPDPGRWIDRSMPPGPLKDALNSGRTRGVLHAASPLDGVRRVIAFRVLPDFGVVVSAAIAIDDLLAGWWDTVVLTAVTVAVLAALLGWLIAMVYRSLGREEELISGLERSVNERTREADERAEEARRANDSKTRFLAAASHDLRQPLQAAGMFVEALSARLGDSPHQGIVDKMRQSIDATQALLSTLLDVSTLEAGHIEPAPAPFNLAPMLLSLASQMEPEATKRGLRLRVVPCQATVVSDPVLLERMLRNLMVNALRYTRSGSILLGCRRRGSKVAICVADTGIGIPEDKFRVIFDDFTRLGTKGHGSDRGLGLGLSVVRRMAELLHHDIEVRSNIDKGSCFTIIVPRL